MKEKIATKLEERNYWLELTENPNPVNDTVAIRCRVGDPDAKALIIDYAIHVPANMPDHIRKEFAELLKKHVKAHALKNI